jgi:large subunit ribosomal protein L25
MVETITVEGQPRTERGKNAARRLRREGRIPAVVYGGKDETLPLVVDPKQMQSILHSPSGHNTLFKLQVTGGASCRAMVRDWVYHPVQGSLLHVDLLRIASETQLKVKVPIHPVGEPTGVKIQGGVFHFILREVELECLPEDIPEEIRVDVSGLNIGEGVRTGNLPLGSRVKLSMDPNRVVLHVLAPRVEEAPAEEEVAEAAAEPELIRKPRAEEDEGTGEAESEK